MRHGPNKLIFQSAQALQDIYNNDKVTKSSIYLNTVSAGKPSLFNLLDKQAHKSRRKVVAQAVNDKAMRTFEPTMMGQINIFLDQLRLDARNSRPVDLTERCKRLGMDIVGLLAFGSPLNLQTDPTYRFFLRGMAIGTYQNNSAMQFPLLKKLLLHYLLIVLGYAQRMKYLRMLQNLINTRLSEEKHARNDFYSFVIDHLDEADSELTANGLWSEALFLFPAGM